MERRQHLQIPGPTNIPDRILRSLAQPLVNHRGPEFEDLLEKTTTGLKKVLRTDNDILLFPSSGSGALESAVANLFSPGDTIAVVCQGVFSERMAVIAEGFGLKVRRIEVEWGRSVKPEEIRGVLEEDVDQLIRAVCLPHNETTTAIANDVRAVGEMMKASGHPALYIVDAISSLACLPFEQDAWGVDVAISASQKGLMLPPGLSLVSLNEKAWAACERSTMPRWYWDYGAVRSKNREGQMPYTPPTTLLFGLKEALAMLEEESLEEVWTRHALMGRATRDALSAMGLRLFAEDGYGSDALTAAYVPEGISYKEIAALLREKYDVIIGGGLQKLQGKILRIGHLGAIYKMDIYAVLGALELTLIELGHPVEPGTAARSLTETFLGKTFSQREGSLTKSSETTNAF